MTDTWQNAAVPPPPPTTPPPGALPPAPIAVNPFIAGAQTPSRQAPSRTTLVALAAAAVVAAAGAWFAFGQSSGQPIATPPAPGPSVAVPGHTAAATPAVEQVPAAPTTDLDLGSAPSLSDVVPKIEQFVEESRGHRFKRHVPVTPLDNKAFVKALRKGNANGSGGSDPYISVKALHLVPAGLDASGPVPDSAFAGIAGFYDFRTKHLYVRGTTLNPLTQSILAHELTHALDDQYFDLAKVRHKARNSDQSEAILSLIEGDARSVENHFSQALTAERQHQEDAERAAYFQHLPAGAANDLADPFVLNLFGLFPYEMGSIFVGALQDAGGAAAVDAAFKAPPTSTLDILDPDGRYLERVKTVKVAAPKVAGKVVDRDTLGPLGLASVLSEGHPIDWSRESVVEGWRGDAYVTVRTGKAVCVHDSIQTSTAPSQVALAKALRAWAARHPGASVTTASKTGLLLVSCKG